MGKYGVYSKFDINKHAKTFINYLEVVIDKNGVIAYAVPSHQEYLIKYACNSLNIDRKTLDNMCPKEMYYDYMSWLLKVTQCVCVWNDFCKYYDLTSSQIVKLRELKMRGLYRGKVPPLIKQEINKQ